MLELVESICNQGEKQGEWINGLDVIGSTGNLKVKAQHGADGEPAYQSCSGPECQALVLPISLLPLLLFLLLLMLLRCYCCCCCCCYC